MGYLTSESESLRRFFGGFSALVAIGAIACLVAFIAFASIWEKDLGDHSAATYGGTEYVNQTRTEYAYYGAVILMLALLVLFNGYHTLRLSQ
jgi:hypothetical protein